MGVPPILGEDMGWNPPFHARTAGFLHSRFYTFFRNWAKSDKGWRSAPARFPSES